MALEDSCILWNKMGSDAEVSNSEIGIDGTIHGTLTYTAAKFDNGVNSCTNVNYVQFVNGNTSPQVGIMEFWWKPAFDGTYASSADIFTIGPIVNHWGQFYYVGGGTKKFRCYINVGGVVKTQYDWTPWWSTNELHHVLIAFNSAAGAQEKIKIYKDGVFQVPTAYTKDTSWIIGVAKDWWLQQVAGVTNAIVDNLKVYSVADAATIADVIANRNNEGWPILGRPFMNRFNRIEGIDL